jgi:hypothetical protein
MCIGLSRDLVFKIMPNMVLHRKQNLQITRTELEPLILTSNSYLVEASFEIREQLRCGLLMLMVRS